MASFWKIASRGSVPMAATAAFVSQANRLTFCEAEPVVVLPKAGPATDKKQGMDANAEGDFHDIFPARQLWKPALQPPLWDANWDGREMASTGDKDVDRKRLRHIRKAGVTRHIILVRHGQYDETHKEDEKRILTDLGKVQADLTGKRLAELLKGAEDKFGPCKIKVFRVSDLARAKETADIIAAHLPTVERAEPDPVLNEGRPCHHIPGGRATARVIEATDAGHPRIEEAYNKYFYRAPFDVKELDTITEQIAEDGTASTPPPPSEADSAPVEEKHEFEIIVCHANVIRYFLCRAIQIPPEVWLRMCPFNCSLTYMTIRPTGTVSVRMLGDIGHLPYNASTFSGRHGFNW